MGKRHTWDGWWGADPSDRRTGALGLLEIATILAAPHVYDHAVRRLDFSTMSQSRPEFAENDACLGRRERRPFGSAVGRLGDSGDPENSGGESGPRGGDAI